MTTLAPKNNISPAAQHRVQFQAFIKNENVLKNISETLGSETKTKRFVASVISAVSMNQALQECQAPTIISAALLGESLDLSPSPQLGHYYLVPFKDNRAGVINATFQLGYKGYIQLAIRSGQYKKMNVIAIKEGDCISMDIIPHLLISCRSIVLNAMPSKSLNQNEEYFQSSFSGISPFSNFLRAFTPPLNLKAVEYFSA